MYAKKCLEAGSTGATYSKAYVMDCHNGLYQQWSKVDNKYVNKAFTTQYLGAAHCGSPPSGTTHKLLELRGLDNNNGHCDKAQTWYEYFSLKSLGLCADLEDGSNPGNLMKVRLVSCDRLSWSQLWFHDSLGRLINGADKLKWCLEAGVSGNLYDDAFIFECHSTNTHQRWSRVGNKYLNQDFPKYLGVANCGNTGSSDNKWLELRDLNNSSGICNDSQSWNT